MAQISLRSIMLMFAYAAVCSMVYVSPNLWIGWLVVFSTAMWMALAIVGAFQSRDRFTLGFAVTGCTWLIVWLGFAIQTPTSIDGNDIRANIYRIMTFGREIPKFNSSMPMNIHAQLHDLYVSGPMATQDASPHVPDWHNAMRLLVCLTALAVACVGGSLFQFHARFNRNHGNDSEPSP